MRSLNERTITDEVLGRFSGAPDARLRQVMESLIRHLHEFAREVGLTPREWAKAIEFLTELGHITDDKRQEFILLSDTLGLSALVDLIANRDKVKGATESSLLGPFYREGAPEIPTGANVARDVEGEPLDIEGRVVSTTGAPIAGAVIDVWQAAPSGLYDVQFEDSTMNLRARFRSDSEGRFAFKSVKPASYPVPYDGPVGRMLNALGRHPYRPAHIHFKLSADGYRPLTTALYIEGDKYLDSDAVFGSRASLVVGYRKATNGGRAKPDSIWFEFALEPEKSKAAKGQKPIPRSSSVRGK
jgi:hydroxyquinol 1,2-dioxygenase